MFAFVKFEERRSLSLHLDEMIYSVLLLGKTVARLIHSLLQSPQTQLLLILPSLHLQMLSQSPTLLLYYYSLWLFLFRQ